MPAAYARGFESMGPSEAFDLLSWSVPHHLSKIQTWDVSLESGGLGASGSYSNEILMSSVLPYPTKNIFLAFAICGSMLPLSPQLRLLEWICADKSHTYIAHDYNLPSPNICPMIRWYQDVLGWDSYSRGRHSPSLTCSPY